jgi:hypothetical protein
VGLRRFLTYYREQYGDDEDLNHFLERLYRNEELPPHKRERLAEAEISDFISWIKKQGTSANSIRTYFSMIQNSLAYYHIRMSARWIGNLPPAITRNQKHRWTIDQIRGFVEAAPNYRDKAIIMVMFAQVKE